MRRGFSLVETMVALALFALILGLIGFLMHRYSTVVRFASAKDRTVRAVLVGLNGAALEASCAVRIVSTGSQLEFERVESDSPRYQAGTFVNGYEPSHLWRVVYRIEGTDLVREVYAPSTVGSPVTSVVGSGLIGFNSSQQPDGSLLLDASFQEETKVVSLSALAWPRCLKR